MSTVTILGSTGVIGRLALEVIDQLGDSFHVRALAAGKNMETLADQVRRWRPEVVSVYSDMERDALNQRLGADIGKTEVLVGEEGLAFVADVDTDKVISAIVGTRGLMPTWRALQRRATVLLANKETLVAAGDLVMEYCRAENVQILPVDSEHSALFQCLHSGRTAEVEKYWVTASGGPFRTWSVEDIRGATIQDALRHPNWNMGQKITIDSSTLMNKGLEVIEAHHLFQASYDKIEVVVHPESIVHSLVEFQDGSYVAQLGTHDMRLPIQYALTYPSRTASDWPKLDLVRTATLRFEAPDMLKFPCLRLAYEAGRAGGYAPCVLNAANEVAVEAVLNEQIPYYAISHVVEAVLSLHPNGRPNSVEDVLEQDRWARERAFMIIQRGGWNA